MNTKSKKKVVKAWAILKRGKIPLNNDDPQFLCVFETKDQAADAFLINDDAIVPCTITYTL